MPRYFVFALQKGLMVLEAFSDQKDTLSLSEVAKITGMNLPSTTRYIHTLRDLGYLNCDPTSKRYSLTPKVLSLGFTFINNIDLRKRLYPYMLDLNKKYGVNVNLAILEETEIIFIERFIGSSLSNLNHTIGTRLPAYCTSLGISMLAFMNPQEAVEVIDKSKIKRFTPHTMTDRSEILREIDKCRQRGYSIVSQQTALGWYNVSVPIIIGKQVEGALGISYPLDFIDDPKMENEIIQDLIQIGKDSSYLAK